MQIDKTKKLNRQRKVFSTLLYFFTIALGVILSMVLLSIGLAQLFISSFWLGILIMTILVAAYILPVLGVVAILLFIMYLVKLLRYTGKKGMMIFRTILSTVLLIIMLIASYITLINYGLSNTYEIKIERKLSEISDVAIKDNLLSMLENEGIENLNDTYVKKIVLITNLGFRENVQYKDENGISKTYSTSIDDTDYGAIRGKATEITWITQLTYMIFLILSIVSLVLWHDNLLNQYKFMVQEAIKKENGKDLSDDKNNSLTEETIKVSVRKKIIITTIIILTVIVAIVVIYVIYRALEEAETKEKLELLNQMDNSASEEEKNSEEYTYFSDDLNGILIEMKAPFRDRYIVEIYKTKDGGETWNKIESNLGDVYIGSKFMFINENVGFCHDPHGGVDSYASLKITSDGGKTWDDVQVNKPNVITENNIFFKDLPSIDEEKLTVVAYTVRLTRYPNEKYYKFESTDLGKTWNFVEELDDIY